MMYKVRSCVLFTLEEVSKSMGYSADGEVLRSILRRYQKIDSNNIPSWDCCLSGYFEIIIEADETELGRFNKVPYVTAKGVGFIMELVYLHFNKY